MSARNTHAEAERRARIIELAESGLANREIADRLGVSVALVGMALGRVRARRELAARIVEMAGRGISQAGIARELGVSQPFVGDTLKRERGSAGRPVRRVLVAEAIMPAAMAFAAGRIDRAELMRRISGGAA